jgi:hypothetical protein
VLGAIRHDLTPAEGAGGGRAEVHGWKSLHGGRRSPGMDSQTRRAPRTQKRHSWRRAMLGLTRVARRAGTYAATQEAARARDVTLSTSTPFKASNTAITRMPRTILTIEVTEGEASGSVICHWSRRASKSASFSCRQLRGQTGYLEPGQGLVESDPPSRTAEPTWARHDRDG